MLKPNKQQKHLLIMTLALVVVEAILAWRTRGNIYWCNLHPFVSFVCLVWFLWCVYSKLKVLFSPAMQLTNPALNYRTVSKEVCWDDSWLRNHSRSVIHIISCEKLHIRHEVLAVICRSSFIWYALRSRLWQKKCNVCVCNPQCCWFRQLAVLLGITFMFTSTERYSTTKPLSTIQYNKTRQVRYSAAKHVKYDTVAQNT
jgi:hypothetical protein